MLTDIYPAKCFRRNPFISIHYWQSKLINYIPLTFYWRSYYVATFRICACKGLNLEEISTLVTFD